MANESWLNKGSALTADGTGGATVAWSMHGVTNGAGRVSAQYDLGALPRGCIIEWACELQLQATPTQGKAVELYIAEAPDEDSAMITGDPGTADAALGDVDMRRNMRGIGQVVSENAAASEKCNAAGSFFAPRRYISFVGYNDTGATINATAANFKFKFRVIYPQAQ